MGIPAAGPVCPRVVVAAQKLVHRLEEQGHVLSFQVNDAEATFILETADHGPGHLTVPAGARGSPLPQHPTAGFVDAVDGGFGEGNGSCGVGDLCGEDGVHQREPPTPVEKVHPPRRDAALHTNGKSVKDRRRELLVREGEAEVVLRERRGGASKNTREAHSLVGRDMYWEERALVVVDVEARRRREAVKQMFEPANLDTGRF